MNALEVMEGLRRLAERLGVGEPGDFIGLALEEIAAVELDQGTRLPDMYRAFLQVMGKRAGRMLDSVDFLYPGILGIKDIAQEILEEDGASFRLGPEEVVFEMHQGYIFTYLGGATEDPPVFAYKECDNSPTKVGESFSEYISLAIYRSAEGDPFDQ